MVSQALMLTITERVAPFLGPVVGSASRALSFKQMDNGTVMIGGGIAGFIDSGGEQANVRLAGLAACLAFHRRSIEAAVHEQVGELGEIGAGLNLSPNALKALRALGVEDDAIDRHRFARANAQMVSGNDIGERDFGFGAVRRSGSRTRSGARTRGLSWRSDAREASAQQTAAATRDRL